LSATLGDLLVVQRPYFDPVTSILEDTWLYYKKRGDELNFLGKTGFQVKIYTVRELAY